MASINPEYNQVSKAVDRLQTTQKVATAAKWVGIAAAVFTVGALVAAAVLSGKGQALAFKATLYGGTALGGITLTLLITFLVAKCLNSSADKKLSGEAILQALRKDNRPELVDKIGSEGFKRLMQINELKDEAGILANLALYPEQIAANLLYLDTEVISALDCEALAGEITPLLAEINEGEYTEAFYLYGAISQRFGQPHPICFVRGGAEMAGEMREWNRLFAEAVSPEISTIRANLAALADKYDTLSEGVRQLNEKLQPYLSQ